MTPVALTVNGRKVAGAGRAAHPSGRFPARALPPDRHPSRLRARRMRRLHGADRRQAGALLHHLRGRLRRHRGAHHRRVRRRSDDAASCARHSHASMALQCGFCTPGMLIAARDIVRRLPGRGRAAHPRRAVRQSVPLHRLSRHRQGGGKRGRGARGRNPRPSHPRRRRSQLPFHAFVPTGEVAPPSITAPASALEEARKGWTRFEESFVVARSPATRMGDRSPTFLPWPPACRGRADRARREYRQGKDADKARSDRGRRSPAPR